MGSKIPNGRQKPNITTRIRPGPTRQVFFLGLKIDGDRDAPKS